MTDQHDDSRRRFVRKAAYVAPAILSLGAVSSVAKAGSWQDDEDEGKGRGKGKGKGKGNAWGRDDDPRDRD